MKGNQPVIKASQIIFLLGLKQSIDGTLLKLVDRWYTLKSVDRAMIPSNDGIILKVVD